MTDGSGLQANDASTGPVSPAHPLTLQASPDGPELPSGTGGECHLADQHACPIDYPDWQEGP
jgi:hypothetical protein